MKNLTFVLILISLSVCSIECLKERNIIQNALKEKTSSLGHLNEWRTKLKADFKTYLTNLHDNLKKDIITEADNVVKTPWEVHTALNYLEYKMKGSGGHWAGLVSKRLKRIEALVLAELLTEKEQYLHEVANGLWLVLEESTWCFPEHIGWQRAGRTLPDPDEIIIDLGVGDKSAYMAWVKFLMGDKLSKLSPIFEKRIDYELNRRVIQPFLHNNYKNWMGLEGQPVNNWNTFITTDILITTLLTVEQSKALEVINRCAQVIDHWLNFYGDDGGCNEGPGYWNIAGGRFIQFVYWLMSASNHQVDFSKNQLIDNIGEYIYKMHINGDYFVNFADAHPRQIPDPTPIYLFGQIFNNTDMKKFAAFLYHLNPNYLMDKRKDNALHQNYLQMVVLSELPKTTPKAPQPLESWFPDLQVVTLRSEKGSAKGLFLGAKAGHNGESHNHNDVGNFVLYIEGLPALIDIGVGVYNNKTFSGHRYELFNTQSQWHNCPTINGVMQHVGAEYAAHNVSFYSVDGKSEFRADISGAYPKEANVKSWVRSLTFDRTHTTIELSETYKLDKFIEPSKIHFITILSPTHVMGSGEVVLKDEKTKLVMKFDSKLWDVVIDEHNTSDDGTIHKTWGEAIKRVSLVLKHKELEGKHSIVFQ